MNWKLAIAGLFILSFALAQCVEDGVCTLEEYKLNCSDCVIHNVSYPTTNATTNVSFGLPNWPWWVWGLIGVGVLAVVLLVVVIFVIYYVWKKRGKL